MIGKRLHNLTAGPKSTNAYNKVWGYGPQDMGRTIGGGPAHKIKACTALLGVHRKTLYNTK